MKKYFILLCVITITLFTFFSCESNNELISSEPTNNNQTNNNEPQQGEANIRFDIQLTDVEKEMAKQNADFSIRLLQAANDNYDDNSQIILSPLSASFGLSMVTNGAVGDTQDELLETMGFDGFSTEEINAFNKKLIVELVDLDNTTSINIANSLWLNNGFIAKDGFKRALTTNYDAEVKTKDFADIKTIDQINEWCEKKTKGNIKNFIKELSPEHCFVLLNSIYFKGGWASKFGQAIAGEFTTEEGAKQDVEYLSEKENRFLYTSNELFSMAELPYGNAAYGLAILLPQENVGIAKCLSALTGDKWLEAINSMKWTTLDLKLPKFNVKDNRSLVNVLKMMGIAKAFDSEADLSALSERRTFISDVIQANYLSIDENGTEASAITQIIGGDLYNPPTEIIDFHVNRPFLYFIKEKSTNTILFMGKMGHI